VLQGGWERRRRKVKLPRESYEAHLSAPGQFKHSAPVCRATDAFCDNYFHEQSVELAATIQPL